MAERRRLLGMAAVLAAAALAAAGAVALATCRCGTGELELVFVLDTTASMKAIIGTVREQCVRMVEVLEGRVERLRVGVVLYNTSASPDYVTRKMELTRDRKAIAEFVRDVGASGGGYEAVEQGLRLAVESMDWTAGARKVVVIVGDEPPAPEKEDELIRWADEARKRGIAVNTITGSETAWRYFSITNHDEYQEMYDAEGEALKRNFRLPCFVRAAEHGGGKAVGGADVREVLGWLLAFGLGGDAAEGPVNVDAVLKAEPGAKPEAAGAQASGTRAVMARLKYRGDWATPRDFQALAECLSERVRISASGELPSIPVTAEALDGWPLVYLSGHGPVTFSDGEKRALAGYLAAGGILWADACCGDERFDESFRALVPEIAGGARLAPVRAEHPLYSVGFEIGKVSVCRSHRSREMVPASPGLEGVELGGRTAVVYSRLSLGSTWRTHSLSPPCMMDDEDGRRLSANILLYFMSR